MVNLGSLGDMHPVDQAIRAEIRAMRNRYCEVGTAVLAVLDLHQPDTDEPGLCGCCFNAVEEQYEYPCPTVKAIADAMGITT